MSGSNYAINGSWVIQKYAHGKDGIVEYWAGTGVHALDFSIDKDDAILFVRLKDAELVMKFILSNQPAYRVIEYLEFKHLKDQP